MDYYPAYQPNRTEYTIKGSEYLTGFEDGYREGKKASYHKGKERGYEDGYTEGIRRGIIFGGISMIMGLIVTRATSRVE